MATHSSILAWRIPWTEEPGRLQSLGSQRVRHDRASEHTCSLPFSFSVSFWDPYNAHVIMLDVAPEVSFFSSFLFILFFCSFSVISTTPFRMADSSLCII